MGGNAVHEVTSVGVNMTLIMGARVRLSESAYAKSAVKPR